MFYYLFLVLAIVGELIGTNLLKLSMGFTRLIPTIGAIISFLICFYCLSLAMIKIPLGIAYANWSAIGIIATTVISVLIYKEQLNLMSTLGTILIVIGVIILNLFNAK